MTPVRESNLGLVLRQVADQGPRSRATLALELGLNKSTVSSLVGELIEAGLLREAAIEDRPGRVGAEAEGHAPGQRGGHRGAPGQGGGSLRFP